MPHRYRPSALVTSGTAVGIDPVDFNVGDTPHPRQPITIKVIEPITSTPLTDTDRSAVDSDLRPVSTDSH
jgi:hypothetical protein